MASDPKGRTERALTLEEQIRALCRVAAMAHRHHEVWRVYSEPESRAALLPALSHFPDFVNFDEHSHRALAILNVAAVFDQEPRAITLAALCAALESADPERIDALRQRIAGLSAVRKVQRIRHNAIAHRAAGESYDDAYSGAGLTAEELRTLIGEAVAITDALAQIAGVKPPLISFYAASDLSRLYSGHLPA